mmetsp:Transcript_63076/g.114732  ORF Transcript_63076/g.114732 Transcript_63076/m.114732 type:complete len:244 (-) Transcript_63076:85-816(-)
MQAFLPLLATCLAFAGHTRRVQKEIHDMPTSNALGSLAVENPQVAFNTPGVAPLADAQHVAPSASAPRTSVSAMKSRYDDDGSRQNGVNVMGGLSNFAASIADVFQPFEDDDEDSSSGRVKLKGGKGTSNLFVRNIEADKALKSKNKEKGLAWDDMGLDMGLPSFANAQLAPSASDARGGVREERLNNYLNNDLDPTDSRPVRALAGIAILTLTVLLIAVFGYYGGIDGLVGANTNYGTVRVR